MANYSRELFIGLGGTGGKVLRNLYSKMNKEQRENAKYLFIDTDSRDINALSVEGIETVQISNTDSVKHIAEYLSVSKNDNVLEWLPYGPEEGVFSHSEVYNGASQCRFKSRLCFARYLSEGALELNRMLGELTRPGITINQDKLRIVIVSSIAGGTGAGIFIQTALFVRDYFRRLNQSATILGILSCPDVYKDVVDNNEIQSLYANGYAAIRELNAMNLASNQGNGQRTLKSYGNKINLKIATKSEGNLFDSKDPYFQQNVNSKPFDQIYFIDKVNEQGGLLGNIQGYYQVMADIAYERLYSPLNKEIETGESNEMRSHTHVPTAIYGSAGYAKILYPYAEVRKYLAERQLYEDLDSQWLYFDSLWDQYRQQEKAIAEKYGKTWSPEKGLRGRKFIECIDAEFRKENSKFKYLEGMVKGGSGVSRVHGFEAAISDTAASLDKKSTRESINDLFNDPAALAGSGGEFSVLRINEVKRLVKELAEQLLISYSSSDSPAEIYSALEGRAASVKLLWDEFTATIEDAVREEALKLASSILPIEKVMVDNHDKKSKISLRYSLLCTDGGKQVHPLAARYLLYGLQGKCLLGEDDSSALKASLRKSTRLLNLALDYDKEDDNDITVSDRIAESKKDGITTRRKAAIASDLVKEYVEEVKSILVQTLSDVDKAVVSRAYSILKEPINELVALYESFFRSIKTYRTELGQQIAMDLIKHDVEEDLTVFVGASSLIKRKYYIDPTITEALNADKRETYAAAGDGVYSELENRMRKLIEEQKVNNALGIHSPTEVSFDKMSRIFDTIIKRYEQLLEKPETIIKTNVVGAMINDAFAELEISPEEIEEDPAARQRFDIHLNDLLVKHLGAKALPMIRYNENNTRQYYLSEKTTTDLNVSKTYFYLGLNPDAEQTINAYYSSLESFKKKMLLDQQGRTLLTNDEFDRNVIFCFRSVHCLQPTQIYHFLEDQTTDSYYPYYENRIFSDLLSDSPHLDKRWNQHGAMPFISPEKELSWRKDVIKAMIYEFLIGTIRLTKDEKNKMVFIKKGDETFTFLTWPAHNRIEAGSMSRLIECIGEDSELVNIEAGKYDKRIERQIHAMSGQNNSVEDYKKALEEDKLLVLLKSDLISFMQIDPSRGMSVKTPQSISLGGALHIAFLLHNSEERMEEDKDYGETLLRVVEETIDRFAKGLYGSSRVGEDTMFRQDYLDIKKWLSDEFIGAWIEQITKEYSHEATEEESVKETAPSTENRLEEADDLAGETSLMISGIPEALRNKMEPLWVSNNWMCSDE